MNQREQLSAPFFISYYPALYTPILCGEPDQIKLSMINGNVVYQNKSCLVDKERLIANAKSAFCDLLARVGR